MKLKLDENGHVVVKDGHPVYVHEDGKEIPFDAPTTLKNISRLNGEAKSHRERAESLEAKLKPYEAIPDVAAALSALELAGKLDAKKLIDAGAVDKVKEEAQRAFDAKLKSIEDGFKPILQERDTLKAALVNEKIGGSFSRSKMISERLAIPADLVQAKFGHAFKLEGDAIVAYGQDGKQIYSRTKPGNVAEFDEALEILIDNYPHRDSILKGSGASGGGANGGGSGGKRTVTRAQFGTMDAATQAATAKAASAGTVVITD
jgi:hypothetical protein